MNLRPQYDVFDILDGAQGLVYYDDPETGKTERGEIVTMNFSGTKSTEAVNRMGQEFTESKPGTTQLTMSITFRFGQDTSFYLSHFLNPPSGTHGMSRRNRIRRFNAIVFNHDREVPHAGTQKVKLERCWISSLSGDFIAVNSRQVEWTATVQVGRAFLMDSFEQLPSGENTI